MDKDEIDQGFSWRVKEIEAKGSLSVIRSLWLLDNRWTLRPRAGALCRESIQGFFEECSTAFSRGTSPKLQV